MKTPILLTAASIVLLGGCTATRFAGGEMDGIYYVPRQAPARQAAQTELPPRAHAQQAYQIPEQTASHPAEEYTEYADYELKQQGTYYDDGEYYYAPRAFDLDYYYDFSYAARIRRFHRPHFRWSYFDPWFTNMFWYTRNPLYFGISIYHGFGSLAFHFPAFMHFHPGFYWYTWHSPIHWYSPWHFSHHHWGWWSWNTHWHRHWWSFGPWDMWNQGFWSGFHAGLHHGWWSNPAHFQYIYNSRDRSNYLYGHRRPIGTVVGAGDAERQDRNRSFAERFENRNRNNPPTPGAQTTPPGGTGVSERGRTMQPGGGAAGGGTQVSPGRAGGTMVGDPQRGAAGAGTQREVRDRGADGARTEPRETMGGTRPTVRDPQGGRTIREMPNPGATRQPTERPTREMQPERPQQRQPATRTPEQPNVRQPESRNPGERAPEERQVAPQRPRTYTPPSYQQPRSTQEYRSPQMTRPATRQQPTEAQPAPRQQVEQPRQRPQQQTIQRQPERSQPSFSPPPRQQEPQRSAPPVRSEPPPSREPSGGSMNPQPSRSTGSESGRSSEGGRQL